jgi:hypothetical protein
MSPEMLINGKNPQPTPGGTVMSGCKLHNIIEGGDGWREAAALVASHFNPDGSEATAPCPSCLALLLMHLQEWVQAVESDSADAETAALYSFLKTHLKVMKY